MSTKNTVNLSLEQSRKVRGYEIKRMPLGTFLQAVEVIREIPNTLLASCFPGMDAKTALHQITKLDANMLQNILMSAMTTMPAECIRIASSLLGLDEKKLLEDPVVGLDGIVEMMLAWYDLNGIENFTKAVLPIATQVRTAVVGFLKQNNGFSA